VVVVSSRRDSHLRGWRPLYEAVLLREREGGGVVERDLGYADVCLSPSTCMCVWTQQSFQVHIVAASCTLCVCVFGGGGGMVSNLEACLRWPTLPYRFHLVFSVPIRRNSAGGRALL